MIYPTNIIDFINYYYPNILFIRKDNGNRGFYIKYKYEHENEYRCDFLPTNNIINYINNNINFYEKSSYDKNFTLAFKNHERRKKLIALKIKNEYENNFLLENFF